MNNNEQLSVFQPATSSTDVPVASSPQQARAWGVAMVEAKRIVDLSAILGEGTDWICAALDATPNPYEGESK